jgi:hypothetical protein
MSLFTNASNANPEFYLARVPSWAKGQSLTLTFFDIGDINGPPGTGQVGGALKVVAVDATHGSGGAPIDEFAGCRYSHPETRDNTAGGYISGRPSPWDPDARNTDFSDNGSLSDMPGGGCTAQVTINPSTSASYWNGKWATFDVPIPSDYTCNDADFTKCWLKIKYNYPPGSNLHDATTWTATLSGNPVRLTK